MACGPSRSLLNVSSLEEVLATLQKTATTLKQNTHRVELPTFPLNVDRNDNILPFHSVLIEVVVNSKNDNMLSY